MSKLTQNIRLKATQMTALEAADWLQTYLDHVLKTDKTFYEIFAEYDACGKENREQVETVFIASVRKLVQTIHIIHSMIGNEKEIKDERS